MAAPPISDRHLPHFHRRQPVKESVRVAATGNVNTSTGLNAGDVVDGVTLADLDRVLLPAQSTGSQNGLWIVGATPVRAYDQSTDDPSFGFLVRVREGTANAGTLWANTNTTTPTIGTTALTFVLALTSPSVALDDLSDVTITTPVTADRLRYDGSVWRNSALIWRPAMVLDPTSGNYLPMTTGDGDAVLTEA